LNNALEQLIGWFDLGGPIIAVLMMLALIAVAIVLLKLWQFSIAKISHRKLTDDALALWVGGKRERALESLNGVRQPLARVLRTAMGGQLAGLDEELVREETLRVGSTDLETLRHYLRALELIAIVCPLLGLLGTVIGMIDAFQAMQSAGTQVDPAVLSGGIWQALLTTAVGLAIAIPVTLLHSWLERRVERLGHAMEDATTQVFTWRVQAATRQAAVTGDRPFVVPETS